MSFHTKPTDSLTTTETYEKFQLEKEGKQKALVNTSIREIISLLTELIRQNAINFFNAQMREAGYPHLIHANASLKEVGKSAKDFENFLEKKKISHIDPQNESEPLLERTTRILVLCLPVILILAMTLSIGLIVYYYHPLIK